MVRLRMATFQQLLIAAAAFLVPVVPAQDPVQPNVTSSLVLPDLVDPDANQLLQQQWWYDRQQQYSSTKYVWEYKGDALSQHVVSNDSLNFLSSGELNSSIVVQYYSSTLDDGGDECIGMIDHYIQLASHVLTLTESKTAVRGLSVTFHAVNCAIHTDLCQRHQIIKYPTFRMEKQNESNQHRDVLDISYNHLHPYEIIEKLGLMESEIPDDLNEALSEDASEKELAIEMANRNAVTPTYTHRVRNELLNDIHVALDHTLRSVIFSRSSQHATITKNHNEFTVTERDVLKSFLLLVHKTMPSTATKIQEMIRAVIDGFMYATKHQAYMIMLLDQHPPYREQYTEEACASELYENIYNVSPEDSYRCVMWDLLHMMSMGMVDYNGQSYDGTEMLHPATSLHSIFEYVQMFGFMIHANDEAIPAATLENDAHRREFIKLYQDCSFFDRCHKIPEAPKLIYENERDQVSKEVVARITTSSDEWKMVPLYIANLRNAVAQKQLPISRQWPHEEICAACWRSSHSDRKSGKLKIHDIVNLYKYLKVEYGHFDFLTASYRKELKTASTFVQEDSTPDEIIEVQSQTVVAQADLAAAELLRQQEDDFPLLKNASNRRDHKYIVLPVRHGSVCLVFFIGMLARWLFNQWQKKEGVSNYIHPNQSSVSKESACTIQHTFENESVDQHSSPQRRFHLSPTKRNRRLLEKQQEPASVVPLMPLESLEDAIDRSYSHERSLPLQVIHFSPRLSITSRNADSPKKCPNGLSDSLSGQLRRRLPPLPITNSS